MSDDLFGSGDRAHARRTDPHTSHSAADAATLALQTIRRQVEAFAFGKGEGGFIDEELSAAFDCPDKSSYRTRRAELAEVGRILDSGRTKTNAGGRQCVVWVHQTFHGLPTLNKAPPVSSDRTKENAQRVADVCEQWGMQLRAEGRRGEELLEAARLARAWTL